MYREEQLGLRAKTPRHRVSCQARALRPSATRINDCWAMDFMTDELFDGRRIRLLTIVDHFTRESLAIEVEPRFRGQDVVLALERIAEHRKLPKTIQVDNGPEFTSKALDQWAYANQVVLDFSRPGKPTDAAVHRIVQRQRPGRMPERKLVLVTGGRQGEDRILATRLQRTSTPQRSG